MATIRDERTDKNAAIVGYVVFGRRDQMTITDKEQSPRWYEQGAFSEVK